MSTTNSTTSGAESATDKTAKAETAKAETAKAETAKAETAKAETRPAEIATPTNSSHLPLMLALTFSTGVIDAVGYLGLDRVFTGNMTGNVVVLGMGVAHAKHLPILGPVVALAGFMSGAAAAGRAQREIAAGWSSVTSALLGTVAALMSLISAFLFVVPEPSHLVALLVTLALGVAMGMQAGTARHIGVRDVTTVVVTSTLTALSADSWFGNRRGADIARRGTAVGLILMGATVGALLLKWQLGAGVALTACVTGSVALAGHLDHVQRQGRPSQLS